MNVCKIDGCGKEVHGYGVCRFHYNRLPEVKAKMYEYKHRPEVKKRNAETAKKRYYRNPAIKERTRLYHREYYQIPKNKERIKKYYTTHNAIPEIRNKLREYHNRFMAERRLAALKYYSKGIPKCACCGESTYEFLCIDHINGGGNKHRRELGLKGQHFHDWLIKNKYPEGYQVLCHNCNLAKGFYGACPHAKK